MGKGHGQSLFFWFLVLGWSAWEPGGTNWAKIYISIVKWVYRKNLNNWTVCYVVGLSSPSLVKNFLFFFLSQRGGRGRVFAVFFAPFPEKGIPDYIAHRPIVQVFTVMGHIWRTFCLLCP